MTRSDYVVDYEEVGLEVHVIEIRVSIFKTVFDVKSN